jgi:hypothetical protein
MLKIECKGLKLAGLLTILLKFLLNNKQLMPDQNFHRTAIVNSIFPPNTSISFLTNS